MKKHSSKFALVLTLLTVISLYSCKEGAKNTNDNEAGNESSTVDNSATSGDIIDNSEDKLQAALNDLPPADIQAKKLYEDNCTLCHGFDGTLGKFGSTDLKASTMLYPDKVEIITKGKGMMKAFGGELTAEEIELVAGYLIQLKR